MTRAFLKSSSYVSKVVVIHEQSSVYNEEVLAVVTIDSTRPGLADKDCIHRYHLSNHHTQTLQNKGIRHVTDPLGAMVANLRLKTKKLS